jgi:hypothetical protein
LPQEAIPEPSHRTIELRRDIPCSGCGYNLRALAPQGRCPECGRDVSVSLAEHVSPGAAVAPIDPRWRRQMIEAVVLALLALAAAVCSAAQWLGNDELWHRGPNVPLALACTGWVLQWYSALKTTRPEPDTPGNRFDRAVVWGLRVTATVYLAFPALRELRFAPRDVPLLPVVLLVAQYAGMLAAVAFFLRVRSVLVRLSAPARAAQAGMLSWMMALTVAPFAMPYLGARYRDVAEYLLVLPSFQFGSPMILGRVLQELMEGNFDVLRAGAYLPVSLAAVILIVSLLVTLLRIKPDPGDSAGRSGASSSP